MAKQALDKDLVDMQLTETVLAAVDDARKRGVAGPAILGTLIGIGVSVGDEEKITETELREVVIICQAAVRE